MLDGGDTMLEEIENQLRDDGATDCHDGVLASSRHYGIFVWNRG